MIKGKPIQYKVGKMTFVVTPVHREEPDQTIHDALYRLMKKETETR